MKTTRRRLTVAMFAALILGTFVAPALSAEPLRVLLPSLPRNATAPVTCLTLYLAERLSECGDVEVLRSQRDVRVGQWLARGAFDLEGEELWRTLGTYVALDAFVDIRVARMVRTEGVEGAGQALEIRVARRGGVQTFESIVPSTFDRTASFPEAIAQAATAVFKALGLPEADQKIARDPRITVVEAFTAYYMTYGPNAPWPGSPFAKSPGLMGPIDPPHWGNDVAALRVGAALIRGKHAIPRSIMALARNGLIRVLGPQYESDAETLVTIERTKETTAYIDDIESLLMGIAQPLIYGGNLGAGPGARGAGDAAVKEIDEIEGTNTGAKGVASVEVLAKPTTLSAATGTTEFTPAQRAAALRLLGKMASAKGLPLIESVAKRNDPAARQAAAAALAGYSGDDGITALEQLARDADAVVAFVAARSLWQRGRAPADFRDRALATLDKGEPQRTWAAEALMATATKADLPLLDRMTTDRSPAIRAGARRAMLPFVGGDPERLARALTDSDVSVLLAAIAQAPANPTGVLYDRLVQLANDPDTTLAWAARDALASRRPADPQGQAQFDLATAAPYLRQKVVAALAARSEPWARQLLANACANLEPHTRIAALQSITRVDPGLARPALAKATTDPHRLVRLHAASLLAEVAGPEQVGAIEAAAARESNPATRLYLRDALAHAQGKPVPPPAPEVKPVNSIQGGQNIAWLTSGGDPDSPFGAYYQMSDPIKEAGRKAHDKGKAFLVRVSPIGDPGVVMVDPLAQDDYWLGLDREIDPKEFPYIDGFVYGEESMSLSPGSVWPQGWRLFCAETGIDPKRVAGDIKNLNRYEKNAWKVWGMRRGVEGFNRLYDYTKLQYGKLRPGIQVCTFLGEQALWDGPNDADFDWKFDVGGVYHYWGDSRKTSYSLVRRHKTIWPDRPVLWLSEGIGVYERTPIQYHTPVPKGPLLYERWRHSYVDAMTAWMAGADTGWFSIWVFLKHDWRGGGIGSVKGPTIRPEQIYPGSPDLDRCIDFAFAGVDTLLHTRESMAKEEARDLALQPTAEDRRFDALVDNIQHDEGEVSPITAKVLQDRAAMNIGFQFYRKHLYDLGRLFSSLPRNNTRPDTLVIQPGLNVWEGAMGSPGSDLAVYFDFLLDVNKITHMDLSRYRYIAVKNPGPVTDATIAALTKWLRESPGLLYVHLDLTSDNADQYGTPENFEGRLKNDWPWEADTTTVPVHPSAPRPPRSDVLVVSGADGASVHVPGAVVARSFDVKGPYARAIYRADGKPALVAWRHPDFKGAAVFDGIDGGGVAYRKALAGVLNGLHAEAGVGIKLDGPVRHIRIAHEGWIAESTNGGEGQTVPGVDLLFGERNPLVGPGRNATFVGKNFQGRYAAAYNGISVLCERPIEKVEKIPGGIRLRCDGLIQAASDTGQLDIKPDSGVLPPAVPDKEINQWIIARKDEGLATLRLGTETQPSTLVYFRCARTVTLTTR